MHALSKPHRKKEAPKSRSRNHNRLTHTRHPGSIHSKQHPSPRQRHPRIRRQSKRISIPRRLRSKGDTSLIRIDGMGGTAHTDQAPLTDSPRRGSGEGTADFDTGDGHAVDDGTGGEGATAGVEVGRVEELAVVVVRGAGAAEAAAAVEHRGVGHEHGGGVVGARDGHGRELGEGVGGRVEELGRVLRRVVGEGVGVDLAARDEDGAVGEDDAVGEGALVGHVADGGDGGLVGGSADGDDVGVGGGVGVLVVDGAADGEDLAGYGVVHCYVTGHGVRVARASSG